MPLSLLNPKVVARVLSACAGTVNSALEIQFAAAGSLVAIADVFHTESTTRLCVIQLAQQVGIGSVICKIDCMIVST
jgi:hypothetical protein